MDDPVFTDKGQFPTAALIDTHLGSSRPLWISLFEQIHRDHPDFTERWRYYLDGKRWLMKVSRKEKTIFWLAVTEGSFRTTFYFTEKAERPILDSALSDELKKQYRDGRKNKLRGITVVYKKKRDVEDASRLIEIKTGMK